MLARFVEVGVEFTPSAWAVAYVDRVARCYGGDSNHAAHEWAAHGLSDVCHDVKSAMDVGFAPDLESCGRFASTFLHHVCHAEYAQLVADLGEAQEPTEDMAMRKLCSECLELELGIKESGPTLAIGEQQASPVEPGEEAESPH
eukprot:jgi/Tetstr1/430545/TSEL_020343.t1